MNSSVFSKKTLDVGILAFFAIFWLFIHFGSARTEQLGLEDVAFPVTNDIHIIPESGVISATGEDPWLLIEIGRTSIMEFSLAISEVQDNGDNFSLYYIPADASGISFREEWKAFPDAVSKHSDSTLFTWSFPYAVDTVRIDPPASEFVLDYVGVTSYPLKGLSKYGLAALVLYFIIRLCCWTDSRIMKKERQARWATGIFLMLMIVTSILKIWLVQGQYLTAIGGSGHDDALFLHLAKNILMTGWLGEYTQMTLIKGPFYPMWIAFSFLLGLPLLLSQHLLYLSVCLMFTGLLYLIVKKPCSLVLLHTILIFSPATFSIGLTRVLRVGIYPSLALLVIACLTGLYTWRNRSVAGVAVWTVGTGISFAAFWLTREEGIWLIPTCFLLISFIVFDIWRNKTAARGKRIAVVLSSGGISFLIVLLVSSVNYSKYGVFNTVEFKTDEFKGAYGALSRVIPEKWIQYIPVTREVRDKIYAASPAFAELKPYLEGDTGRTWAVQGKAITGLSSDQMEIAGGWFMWALRDAAALAGYHETGGQALDFYERISEEINAACENGSLPCTKERSTMTPPWRREYFQFLIHELYREIPYFVSFQHFPVEYTHSFVAPGGTERLLQVFEDITIENVAPLPGGAALPAQDTVSRIKIRWLKWIQHIYSIIFPILSVAAIILYLVHFLFCVYHRKLSFLDFLLIGLFAGAIFRFFILLYIQITSFPSMHDVYLAPSYPLFLGFCILSIVSLDWHSFPLQKEGEKKASSDSTGSQIYSDQYKHV